MMKSKLYFIIGLTIVATISYDISFEKENSSLLSISENIEALANEETSDSGLRGTCLGNVGPCISYCPSCNRTIKGTSGKNGPLENIHGTCICGQKF